MKKFYIVPVIGTGTRIDSFRPKYISDYPITWSRWDYGQMPWTIVGAEVDSATDAAISANSDCYTLPDNIDANLSPAQVTAVQNKLESANLPAEWITTSLTWRSLLKFLVAYFIIAQRFQGLHSEVLFTSGITLGMRMNQIPVSKRNKLTTAAENLGFDTSGIQPTDSLRVALKKLAVQWQGDVILGNEAL